MRSKAPDSLLVSRVMLLDDRKAFAALVERYQGALRRFFLHHTGGDAMLADDLAQETFLKCYYGIRQYKGLAGFSTWLYRIAYNLFLDYARTAKPTAPAEAIPEAAASASADERMDITAALALLSTQERAVVSLFYIEDRTVEDVARILSMPQGTVKSHLARSRCKLADFLKKNGYETK